MKINTRYFGEIEAESEDTIFFPEGLFGFESFTEFLLIRFFDEDDSLLCLQSTTEAYLAFVLMHPMDIKKDYAPTLSETDLKALGVTDAQSLSYYVIGVIKEDPADTTVNLRCPIAIHPETRQARQIILEDNSYSLHYPAVQPAKEEVSC